MYSFVSGFFCLTKCFLRFSPMLSCASRFILLLYSKYAIAQISHDEFTLSLVDMAALFPVLGYNEESSYGHSYRSLLVDLYLSLGFISRSGIAGHKVGMCVVLCSAI